MITFTSPLPALTSPLGTEKLELEDGGKFPISLSSSVSQSMLQLSSFEAFPSYSNQIATMEIRRELQVYDGLQFHIVTHKLTIKEDRRSVQELSSIVNRNTIVR